MRNGANVQHQFVTTVHPGMNTDMTAAVTVTVTSMPDSAAVASVPGAAPVITSMAGVTANPFIEFYTVITAAPIETIGSVGAGDQEKDKIQQVVL